MRCVVDERGNLAFASPSVGWALGLDTGALMSKPASSVIEIVSSHDSHHQSLAIDQLSSGFYEVALLRQRRDPLLLQARIDVIQAPTGRKYTVLWLDPDNRLRRQKNNDFNQAASDFAHFVIDNQKKLEEAPRAEAVASAALTDGELKNFLDLSNDLLGVYRRDGTFVRANPAFNKVLGYSDMELKLFPFIDLIHPDDRDPVWSVMQKMLQADPAQEARIDFESRARGKDGSVHWLKWVHKTSGDHVYIVGRDVTDIKSHEAELTRREEQLSEAQKIGRMGHWYWEAGQPDIEFSDQIYSIFGLEHGKFMATIDNVEALLVKGDVGRIYKAFQRALIRKKSYEMQFRLRRPKGGVRYIHCEGRCKIDPRTGMVEALYGVMQDITERTLHEQALREAKEAAESAYASKTRFLANMSHELRTPLNAIIGFSEMIQRQLLGPVGNARYLDYIGSIRQSGEHLLDLINDILDMSKIEVGKYEIYAEEINVGKLIRLAVHMVETRAQESNVHLDTSAVTEDIQIMADRRALMQVVLNLLSNAVKFTNAGGTIALKCARAGGMAEITVADTGIGIPKDKLGVVTKPFEQVGSELTRRHEGSGLGLAITKDLIELHGGKLEIESEVDVGTTVRVYMPLKLQCSKKAKVVSSEAVSA